MMISKKHQNQILRMLGQLQRINMRRTIPNEPRPGDIKTVNFFAWRPIRIGQDWRWLERVTVEYRFRDGGVIDFRGYWFPVKFIDKD